MPAWKLQSSCYWLLFHVNHQVSFFFSPHILQKSWICIFSRTCAVTPEPFWRSTFVCQCLLFKNWAQLHSALTYHKLKRSMIASLLIWLFQVFPPICALKRSVDYGNRMLFLLCMFYYSAFVFHLLVQSVLVKCNIPASFYSPSTLKPGCRCVVWCLAQVTRTVSISSPLDSCFKRTNWDMTVASCQESAGFIMLK